MRLLAFFVILAGVSAADDLPIQTSCGGGESSPPTGNPPGAFSEFPVASEGAEGMTGYLFLPDAIPAGRRVPLLFVLHGNGDSGKGRHRNLSNVSSKDDPIIVVGIQYQKEVKFNAALWPGDVTLRSFEWLLAKVVKEQPADPENVYVQGFSMGCGYAGGWAYKRWQDAPDTFPFRALFFNGSPSPARSKDAYPPVPIINMVGELETAVMGSANIVKSVKTWSNQLARLGAHVEYHEIPKMEHAVNAQCHQIIRDTILRLRGPRDLPAHSTDPAIAAACRLLRRGQVADGYRGLTEIAQSKELDAKARKAGADVKKKLEDWAATEMKRVESTVAEALAKRKTFEMEDFLRLRTLAATFPDQGRKHASGIAAQEKRQADELKRRDEYLAARAQEKDDPAAAKAALQLLAGMKGGRGVQAAAYRMSWWMDPDEK